MRCRCRATKAFRRSRISSFRTFALKDCPQLADATGIHPRKPLDGFSLTGVTGNCAKGIAHGEHSKRRDSRYQSDGGERGR